MQPLHAWLRAPRDLLLLFLLVLGLRFLQQDRALESQRLTELRESAADRVVRSLEQALTATETHLRNPQAWDPTDDALRVVFLSSSIEVTPPNRLLYYPVLPEWREAPDGLFRQAEEYEFHDRNYQAAIIRCRELSSSLNVAVRAGALLRWARNLRKAGQHQSALDLYDQLGRIQSVTLGGIPADLLARHARCSVLAELGLSNDLKRESAAIEAGLRTARWQLDHASYLYFSQQASSWVGSAGNPEPVQEALARAVETLWNRWKQKPGDAPSRTGRQCLFDDRVAILALWQSTPERFVGLVLGLRYQPRNWLSGLAGIREFHI